MVWQDGYICLEIFYIADLHFSVNVSFLSDQDNNTAEYEGTLNALM